MMQAATMSTLTNAQCRDAMYVSYHISWTAEYLMSVLRSHVMSRGGGDVDTITMVTRAATYLTPIYLGHIHHGTNFM